MIPNQWYIVLDSHQLRARPIGVTRLGERLVFWRDAVGRASCLRDACVHRRAQLSLGQVVDGQRLQCPFHGLEYDASGRVTLIPADGRTTPVAERFRVHSYPVHEAHGLIWIWWGEQPPPDLQPPAFFEDIDPRFSYRTVIDRWDTHYSRAVENQLDAAHLPFVHYNTIGRGGRTVVDGPGLRWEGQDRFRVFVHNRVDDGRPALRPDASAGPDGDFWLEFVFPNLWQNHLFDAGRIVVAFVPVDAEHTLLYLRFYQRMVRLPLLRDLFNWLATPANVRILHQDRRVVQTQRPKPSALRTGEALFQADRPILEYRRRRQELLDAAGSAPQESPL